VILPDVNVILHAFRKDTINHELSRSWLEGTIESGARFGMSPLALSAMVRLATNKRMFDKPSTPQEAFAFADQLLEQPNCEIVEPGARHWDIFKRLYIETKTTGPKTTDVWYAALAIEHGCEWITFDRDFAQFPGLKWRAPKL
jgi:uncharacterized protein